MLLALAYFYRFLKQNDLVKIVFGEDQSVMVSLKDCSKVIAGEEDTVSWVIRLW